MKKILFFAAFTFFAVATFAQANLQALVKPGTKLIYAVESGDQKYNFIVTVKKLVPVVEFDWEMTEPASISGSIVHTPAAMMTGNTMYNYFKPGPKTLDDQTLSVWLSKAVFAGLKKEGKGVMMKMNTDGQLKRMGTYSDDEHELHILVDGEKDTVEEEPVSELNEEGNPVAKDQNYFTFFDSAKLPIILRMKTDFYIVLKEVRTK